MLRISLINMPFASLSLPSIGLTQLKAVIDTRFADKVSSEIYYLNQEFGRLLGPMPYHMIANGKESHNSGIGEWFFRQVAFPEQPDNIEDYFQRFFPHRNEQTRMYRLFVEEKRKGVSGFMDELIAKYRLDQSDIVGFTSMFTQNSASIAMARKLRKLSPEMIIIMGGANCEAPMGQELVKNVECIDFVFSGLSLKSFPEFIERVLDRELQRCHRINGVFSKANCTAPQPQASLGEQITPLRMIGDELDIDTVIDLDYQSYLDTLESNFPKREVEPNLLFETSRGCWWGEKAHCTFCGLNGMTMNYRSMRPEHAINLIGSILNYYPRCLRFSSVDNILPKSYLKDVLPFLDVPPGSTIFYEVKSDLTEEDLRVLAQAQVKSIQPGIESLATSTLKLMKKGSTAFQNIQLMKNCVMFDINPDWNLLVGFPGEEDVVYKKYLRDLPLLTHLPPPTGVYPVRFDRYSPYFTKAKEYGLDLHPVDYYQLIYPFSDDSLANLAYYFTDRNISAKYFLTMAEWIGKIREKFEAWSARWADPSPDMRPTLYFKQRGNPTIIYDSRASETIEHTLTPISAQILNRLEKPKKRSDLAMELSPISQLDLDREISFLQERGLVFEENDRFLSLVLSQAPSGRETTRRGFGL